MTTRKTKKLEKRSKGSRTLFEVEDKKGDFQRLLEHVQANPVLYAAGAVVIVLVAFAGLVYHANRAFNLREAETAYAKALEIDDPAMRAAALEPLTTGKTQLAAEALYMLGEADYQAQQYDKAKAAYQRLRSEFPDSSNTPAAVEGLGYVAENHGDYQKALTIYKEILEKWPGTFVARRQNLNIGRCQEALKKFADAKAAYQAQLTTFADSSVYNDAKAALDRMRVQHPDLFPALSTAKEGTKAATKPGASVLKPKPSGAPTAPSPSAAPAPSAGSTHPAAPVTK